MTAFIQLRVLLLCGLLGYPAVAHGKGKEGVSVTVPEQASREKLVDMAVKVRPSSRQLDYQQREMLGFIHFGMNTFTGVEWGTGKEEPGMFNPSRLDARSWVKTFKDAGVTGVIFVAKHHDGFCMWPTKWTDHNISRSPYKGGKGDLVREVSAACRELGMKFCIYLSPWDMHEKSFGTEKYNDFYVKQLEELLTNYGPVYLLWFDGAGVDSKVNGKQTPFDWERIFKKARELQPEVLLSGAAPDVRWGGNEMGRGRETEWCVQGVTASSRLFGGNNVGIRAKDRNLGSIDSLAGKKQLVWYPSRAGLPIRKGWFYHERDDKSIKSLDYLVDCYFSTVGQNSNVLPNLSPNKEGIIPEADARRMIQFGRVIEKMKKNDLAKGARAKALSGWSGNPDSGLLFDNNPFTGWATADGTTRAEVEIQLPGKKEFNVIKLQENVRDYGQRVERFAVDAWLDGQWKPLAESTTIGFRKMIRLPKAVKADQLRIRFLDSRKSISFSNFSLYYLAPFSTEDNLEAVRKLDRKEWKITVAGKNLPAAQLERLKDGKTDTYVEIGLPPQGCDIIIDTGKVQKIAGLIYTPVMEGAPGHIEMYDIRLSRDGKTWGKPVASGRFGNIVNNPVEQEVNFVPVEARFVKFSAKKGAEGARKAAVAELDLL